MTKTKRAAFLLSASFLAWEAHHLAALRPNDPAFRAMVFARRLLRAKFERLAATKIASGAWQRGDVPARWLARLGRLYTRQGWRVVVGPVGEQPGFTKGAPNPFAMYRHYVKLAPSKKHVSPWETRAKQYKTRAKLVHALVKVQLLARQFKEGKVDRATVSRWVSQKKAAIAGARGKRREELTIQLRKLEALL